MRETMTSRPDVKGFELDQHGHLSVMVELRGGIVAAFHLDPDADPVLEKKVEAFREALGDVVALVLLEASPSKNLSLPVPSLGPCRICDYDGPTVTRGPNGFLYCQKHLPA